MSTAPTNSQEQQEQEKRCYWAREMDAAFGFMEAMRRYPLQECGEEMVPLLELCDGLEVAFTTRLLNGVHPRIFSIRKGLAAAFRGAAAEMNERGWVMKVEDGYRSPEMQRAQSHDPRHFDLVLQKTMWELSGAVPSPEFMFRRMSAIIATRCRVGTHISGSAIDISVLSRETGAELERGGGYVEISERTPMASPFVTEEERANRREIEAVMLRHDWWAYPYEFWHFSSGDVYAESLAETGRPARYGAVTLDGNAITPIPEEETDRLLEPLAFYEKQIGAALERLKAKEPA